MNHIFAIARRRHTRLPDPDSLPLFLARLETAPGPLSLSALGQMVQIVVTGRDQHDNQFPTGTLSHESSNPAVATIDATGIVTAVDEGQAIITIMDSPSGLRLQLMVDVTIGGAVVDHIGLSATTVNLQDGSSPQIVAADPQDVNNNSLLDRVITASSDTPGVATATVSGYQITLTPVAPGTGVMVDVACDGVHAFITINVTAQGSGVNPNKPGDLLIKIVEKYFDTLPPLPIGTMDTDGFKYAAGSRMRTTIVDVPDAPRGTGKALRGYFGPDAKGGASPFDIAAVLTAAPFSLSAGQLKSIYMHFAIRMSPYWSNAGNVGTKGWFFMQHDGGNHFLNLAANSFQVQTQSPNKNYGSGFNLLLAVNRARWLDVEIELRGNTSDAVGVPQAGVGGLGNCWVDGL